MRWRTAQTQMARHMILYKEMLPTDSQRNEGKMERKKKKKDEDEWLDRRAEKRTPKQNGGALVTDAAA
jgi:hypothetical protein